MTVEYIVGTALAAFFASLAAVAVSAWLSRGEKRREARAEMLRAISRHIDRLWTYSTVHSEVRTVGIGSRMTINGDHAPFKPPVDSLITEVRATQGYFPARSQAAIAEIVSQVQAAEVAASERAVLADWREEAGRLLALAQRVARWDGHAAALPE